VVGDKDAVETAQVRGEIEPTLLIEDLVSTPRRISRGTSWDPRSVAASACVAATKSPTHVVVVRTWSTRQIR